MLFTINFIFTKRIFNKIKSITYNKWFKILFVTNLNFKDKMNVLINKHVTKLGILNNIKRQSHLILIYLTLLFKICDFHLWDYWIYILRI